MEQEIKLVRLCRNCGPITNYGIDLRCKTCGEPTKEEVIVGDAGPMAQAAPISVLERAGRKRMCAEYGKEIAADARYCPYHGIDIPDTRVSESTVTAIAVIAGIFGCHGVGHIMLGKLAIGFLMLFGGWALIAGACFAIIVAWPETGETAYLVLGAVLALAYIVLFIWQVMDASNGARTHNRHYENHKIS